MGSAPDRLVISVSELNSQAKEILEVLNVWVEGEVTGMKPVESQRYYYVYFSLQDTKGKAVMSCAMRREAYLALGLNLENGQNVLVQGKMSLLTQSGRAAFMVNQVEVSGQGKMAAELEKLKNKLQAEGLLSDERKRPLPRLPQRIGVVTSVHSDAWADFQRHSVIKFPVMELTVADSFVQGQKAPQSLVRAIKAMQNQPIEVLVVTRGGGSAEDLAAFNDEQVVRAIAASKIPTIVGVGHEKDVSLADLVADVRASTPTNAGQILTRGYEDVSINLVYLRDRMQQLYVQSTERLYQRLDDAAIGLSRTEQKYQTLPHRLMQISAKLEHQHHKLIDGNVSHLTVAHHKLRMSGSRYSQRFAVTLSALERQLQAVSPINVLSRGYSIVKVNDSIIRNTQQVKRGDTMHIQLAKGELKGLITKIENDDAGK